MKTDAFTLIVALGAGADLATKAWARAALEPYGTASDFLPFISLRLTFNQGISFSLFASDGETGKAILIGITALFTLCLSIWALRTQDMHERAALSMIVAGAVGNLIDRAVYGAVTDMLDLHFGSWHPFVFNVADIWISAGVCALLTTSLLTQRLASKGA